MPRLMPHSGYALQMHNDGVPSTAPHLIFVNVLSPRAVKEAVDCCIQADLIGDPTVVKTGGGRIVGKDATGNNIWQRYPARKTLRRLTCDDYLTISLPADFMVNRPELGVGGRPGLLAVQDVIKYFDDIGTTEGIEEGSSVNTKHLKLNIAALWWRMTHDYALVPDGGEMSYQAEGSHCAQEDGSMGEVLLIERESKEVKDSRKECAKGGLMWRKAPQAGGGICDDMNYTGHTMCPHATFGYPCYGPRLLTGPGEKGAGANGEGGGVGDERGAGTEGGAWEEGGTGDEEMAPIPSAKGGKYHPSGGSKNSGRIKLKAKRRAKKQ